MRFIQVIVELFRKIQRLGVLEDDPVTERKHIAVTNVSIASYAVVFAGYIPFLSYYSAFTSVALTSLLVTFFVLCFCLFLCSKRLYMLAAILGLVVGLAFIWLIFFLYGTGSHISLYCLTIVPFPFVVFKNNEKLILILSVLCYSFSFLFMHIDPLDIEPLLYPPKLFLETYKLINIIGAVSSAIILSVFNFYEISFFENSLINANDLALEQRIRAEASQIRITQSINYSKNIQEAIIPSKEDFKVCFNESFMLYKPKDIVSGDFPWLQQRGGCTYLAAVDCTGHGVPGAMLSLIGNLLLNDIVNKGEEVKTPSEILNELHFSMVSTLKQYSNNNNSDGMDIALCRFSPDSSELLFSGAKRPLYLVRDGVLIQYKGDKFPIGGTQHSLRTPFEDQKVFLEKGDSIYLFSDGYQDQFGGAENKKIGPKRLRELLAEKGSITSVNQNLSHFFKTWKGDRPQIDDVLVIGVKV